MLGIVWCALNILIHLFIATVLLVGYSYQLQCKVKKLRLREVKCPTRGHKACQSGPTPELLFFTTYCLTIHKAE